MIIKSGSSATTVAVSLSHTDGTAYTGLTHESSGLTARYSLNASSSVAITLDDTNFTEISAANFPGEYTLTLPEACFVAGTKFVKIKIFGADDLLPAASTIQVVDYDPLATITGIDAKTTNLPADPASENNVILAVTGSGASVLSALTTLQIATDGITAKMPTDTVAGEDYLDSAISYLDGQVQAVGAIASVVRSKTDNLPLDPASQQTILEGITTGNTDVVSQTTDLIGVTNGKVDSLALSLASVDAELDSLAKEITLTDGLTAIKGDGWSSEESLHGIYASLDNVSGSGSIVYVHTFFSDDDGTIPLAGVTAWVSTDVDGVNVFAGPQLSNASGKTVWMMTAGSFYIHGQKVGYDHVVEVLTINGS